MKYLMEFLDCPLYEECKEYICKFFKDKDYTYDQR